MDETVAYILKSWAVVSVILVFFGFGVTLFTIKVCDLIDKIIKHRKEKHNK